MKKFQDWVNENAGQDMDQNTPDNKEVLSSFVSNKIPKTGDMAYSMYNGYNFVGMLAFDGSRSDAPGRLMKIDDDYAANACPHLKGAMGHQKGGYMVFPPLSGVTTGGSKMQSLSVGYDGPIVWDAKRGMFYAQPDKD
jgi:hypothetical protein